MLDSSQPKEPVALQSWPSPVLGAVASSRHKKKIITPGRGPIEIVIRIIPLHSGKQPIMNEVILFPRSPWDRTALVRMVSSSPRRSRTIQMTVEPGAAVLVIDRLIRFCQCAGGSHIQEAACQVQPVDRAPTIITAVAKAREIDSYEESLSLTSYPPDEGRLDFSKLCDAQVRTHIGRSRW
jgi:hypothetical protein